MRKCVLCLKPFRASKKEHILPNAIGWRRASPKYVCSECNGRTSWLDKELAKSVETLTTLISPPGRRSLAPSIPGLDSDAPIVIRPGGKAELPSVFETTDSAGQQRANVHPDALPDYLETLHSRGRRVKETSLIDSPFDVQFALDSIAVTGEAILAALKAGLHFTAHYIPLRDLREEPVERLRSQLLSDAPSVFELVEDFQWDFDLPAIDTESFYHGIKLIACPKTGALVVRVHVYGMLRIRYVLGYSYEGRRHSEPYYVERPTQTQVNSSEGRTKCMHPLSALLGISHSIQRAQEGSATYFDENAHVVLPPEWRTRAAEAKVASE